MKPSSASFWLAPLLFALVLAACAPASSSVAARASRAAATDSVVTPMVSAATPATTLPEISATSTKAVGLGGQYATDPATVDLASGRPTLVKFFAFW